ncbi:MAG: acyltransferase [Pseudanabaena sp. Salubria-1]|nr:acyltransferase [Pseudanabaena sp. Salubria-1]MCX5933618.1 acyltransferase [Pseudanabaena sp. LacPavin_0818_WC45_MAG_42_6]
MTWELSDLLRAIATTIVIGIHASHHWWFGVHDTTTINLEIFIDTIINQVGRFTVPIFVILSGFALAKSEEKRPFDLKIFFQRRLLRIVPPYILFTLLNIIGQSQFQRADWLERGQQIMHLLATGMGDYHLYFLGIIFQCYIAYPILRSIVFSKLNLYILMLITFVLFSLRWVSATFDLFVNITTFLPNGNHVIYWLSYFQIGIWLAKDRGWTSLLVAKWRSHIWGYLFAIAAIVELSEFYWTAILKNSAEAVGHYARPTVVCLTLTFLLWSMSWQSWQNLGSLRWNAATPQAFGGKSLQSSLQELWQAVKPQIRTFAKASFTTYLVHVWVLRAIAPLEIVGGILYVPLATSISWLIGIILWQLLQRFAVSL